MNYHNITTDDMKNGSGLRVVLWLSGCSHYCPQCQNPQTWDSNSGIPFTDETKYELFTYLSKDYIAGLTLSGGDPLYKNNIAEVDRLIDEVRIWFPTKNIWLYTGYSFDEIKLNAELCNIISKCDVLVDGKYIDNLFDLNYPWAGSTNQRVIDIPRSLAANEVVLWEK